VRNVACSYLTCSSAAWRADDRQREAPTYDGPAIEHLVRQLVEHHAAWTGYFTGLGIEPLAITYEELASHA
jgi:LPS sulfotransferase NodH